MRRQPSETFSEAFAAATLPLDGAASTVVCPDPLLRTVRLVTGLKASTAATWLVWLPGAVRSASNRGSLLAVAVKLTVQLCPASRPIVPGGVNRKRPGAASAIV